MAIQTLQLLAVAVLMVTTASADQWTKTFTFSGKPELRVDGGDGAVHIRVWDRREIEARVTTIGWKIGNGEVQVTGHQEGARVELGLQIPRYNGIFGGRSVRLELQVPRDLRTDIRTGDGSISVESLRGETRLSSGAFSLDEVPLSPRCSSAQWETRA